MPRRGASPAAPRRAGPLEHRLGQFLDKERHTVGLGDDLRRHLGGQRPAGDKLGQGLDLGGCQAIERDAGDVREAGPGRLVFRPEGEDRQYRQGADALDRQIEHFERGRIRPMGVFEQHQYRFLPRQCFELVEQGCQGQAALLGRAQCERRIAVAGRDRQQRGEERRGLGNARRRQYGFELVELRLRRVLGGKAGGTPQLHDKRVQDAVAVIGRALITQPRVRLVRGLGGELSAEPRLADAGLAREQDDLAGAGPGPAQAVAQQGALRRPPDEVGEPAARRLEPALGHGDAFDREGFDRLGKALCCLPAEIGEPEQVADEAAGVAGDDDLPGLRKRLQARRKVGGLADHRLLPRRAFADQIADHDKPGGNADTDGERLRSTGLQAPHRRCYFQPRPHRPLGIVLMRPRIAEIGQHPVAHEFGDKAVVARDDAGNGVLIGADLLAQFLGVEPGRHGGRADEIAEHHRQLPPLGLATDDNGTRGDRRWRFSSAKSGNGFEQSPAMATQHHPEILQILRGEFRQRLPVNLVFAKRGFVALETETS
jgi:hypothetical protein